MFSRSDVKKLYMGCQVPGAPCVFRRLKVCFLILAMQSLKKKKKEHRPHLVQKGPRHFLKFATLCCPAHKRAELCFISVTRNPFAKTKLNETIQGIPIFKPYTSAIATPTMKV